MLYTQNHFDRFYEDLGHIEDQEEREGQALMMAFEQTKKEIEQRSSDQELTLVKFARLT